VVDRNERIGVLKGGLATEREVSLKTGAAVAGALREGGWDVVEVDVGRDLPAQLVAQGVDVAWLALHGRFGEDGCVQGLLEVMGVPYTGSGVLASALAMDKWATKRAVQDVPDVVLAADRLVRVGDPIPGDLLPAVVKPLVGGSTIGISLARTPDELRAGLQAAWKLHPEALVEAFVAGDEITVAVLDGRALPVVSIAPESGFFDFEAKYTKGKTEYIVPSPVDARTQAQAQRAAVATYAALGCRGLARVDFIVNDVGAPVFLELNTLPGMTATSLCPMAAGAQGMSFGALVERILHGATRMEPEV